MRFLVLSDVHGRDRVAVWANRLAEERSVDGIIVLGDITHFGPSYWAGEFLSHLKAKTYAVPGNCDPAGVNEEIERTATSLHGRKISIGGVTFGGFGGSNPTIFNTPFEMSEEEIMAGLRPVMEKGMVLVVHCPPYGILDTVLYRNQHVGSTAIKQLVDEFRPRAVLSGHIHEARGLREEEGTVFMNPGPAKDSFAGLLDLNGAAKCTLLEQVPQY
jgi:Icc-related predicted phosphoesterase